MNAMFWAALVLLAIVVMQAFTIDRLVRHGRRQSAAVVELAKANGQVVQSVDRLARRLDQ